MVWILKGVIHLSDKKKLESGKPSKTAEFMALFRALESTYPRERRLFEDPLAVRFLSPALKTVVYASKAAPAQKFVVWLLDSFFSGARASGITRTRLIDDYLIRGTQDGSKQVVILGSGYDSRAYRIAALKNQKVFEVDHPSTSKMKKEKIQKASGVDHWHVSYVEIEFNSQSLEQTLNAAGFNGDAPAFFIWEGVTNYLTEAAVRQTLTYIGSLAKGTMLAFTYVHRDAIDIPKATVKKGVSKLLKKQGEPWTYGIRPEELPGLLRECGLNLLEDIASIDYRKRYMYSEGRHLDGYEFYRVALAAVGKDRAQ